MEKQYDAKLVLEDGSQYFGFSFGAKVTAVNEVVFNTSMAGYQEIMSDPSYTYQMVVMTYPVIGNYGICDEDFETRNPSLGGLIVRDYNDNPSNFRCTKTLSESLMDYNIPAISGIDTRKLTRSIRDLGSRKILITDIDKPLEECLQILKDTEIAKNAVSSVSSRRKWYSRTVHSKFNVVAIDCGIKLNIVRSLNARGCNVVVVPYNTSFEEIEMLKPDGIFISNGPGDPTDVKETLETISKIKGKYPTFGICLGHQLISLCYGAKTYKLKFGHRGGNHPVKNLANGKIEITSQNHSYAVDSKSIDETRLKATHINILDNTVEGVECESDKIFSVQYHPESAPGPQDSTYLFDKFIKLMEENKNA